jgi:hypothetical protein
MKNSSNTNESERQAKHPQPIDLPRQLKRVTLGHTLFSWCT